MIVAGCDIGSLTAKAVIMRDGSILSSGVMLVKRAPEESAQEVMELAASRAGIALDDIQHIVGTGYGGKRLSFAKGSVSEIACHARGAVWRNPSVRTVVDIGGQDAKAIKLDAAGNVVRYVYNDKCASGTGRFLEIIADTLELNLDDLGPISGRSRNRLTLSNQCVVFAETEIISLVNEGKDIPDIVRALHGAVANRAASLAKSIVVERDVAMSGGVARNDGMFEALGEAIGVPLVRIEDPQLTGAIGAALFAFEAAGAGM